MIHLSEAVFFNICTIKICLLNISADYIKKNVLCYLHNVYCIVSLTAYYIVCIIMHSLLGFYTKSLLYPYILTVSKFKMA